MTSHDVRSSKIHFFENLHLMTFGDPDLITTLYDVQNAFPMHRSSIIHFFENLHLMTFVELDPPPPSFKFIGITFRYHPCICLKIPKILRYHMIYHCRLTYDPAGAAAISEHVQTLGLNILPCPLHCHKKLFRY